MNCKNCHTELLENDDYCRSCGGKVIRNRLSFRNLFEHLSETFFNYDNKLLRTFVQLFKNPEDVIVGYINGVRKKYINPISFFGLALTLSGFSLFIIKKFYMRYLDMSSIFEGFNIPKEVLAESTNGSLEYSSIIYSLFVPVFALISWVVFLDKKYNFTEHIIIYLYSMSLMSILMVFVSQLILLAIPNYYILFSFLTFPLMFIYHCYLLKQIFKISPSQLILRSFMAIFIFIVVYIISTIIGGLIMFFTGSINLEDFKPH
ncbi:DUF3667 domain-containing protein [Winogradskyella ursingii]|uniref:DUF3667 domain-containing protein n=1 Tax=Winogradskyella ursingii TaxID=2686079 RepID=UPI0015C9FF48|nr:DUF3667 domain-containing protein [Winogradskyella ursingii]